MEKLAAYCVHSIQHGSSFQDPFALVVGKEGVPQSFYQQLLQAVPDAAQFKSMYHPDAIRSDGTSTRSVFELKENSLNSLGKDQSALWGDFLASVTAESVRKALLNALKRDLSKRFQRSDESILEMPLFPRVAIVRDQPGFRIQPHPDSASKVITMQWYLASDDRQQGIGTTLYRDPQTPWLTLNYRPNHFYAFAVSNHSWHGRERIPELKSPRLTLSVTYYLEPNTGEFLYI